MQITSLPVEILDIIVNQLAVPDFLSFCRTCKALYQPNIRLDSNYWGRITREEFRLPNRPAVEGDGTKWQKLYKRLLTQTNVFTWGKSNHGCLGRKVREASNPVPLPMDGAKGLGIISDMQCGGWSTSFLTSQGLLYTAGVLDGETFASPEEHKLKDQIARLSFPASYADPARKDNPNSSLVAIRQFSVGRKHVLGLSDSGRIWSWYSQAEPSLAVEFASVSINETRSRTNNFDGHVTQVIAGWNKSSAYVKGTGIIVWNVVRRRRGTPDAEKDTMVVSDVAIVPLTSFSPAERVHTLKDWPSEEDVPVGSVLNWVLLEHFVVFVTDIGRIYIAYIDLVNNSIDINSSIELTELRSNAPYPPSCDVQGSFRSFATFMNGTVAVLTDDWLDMYWRASRQTSNGRPIELPRLPGHAHIPALQDSGVQQIAFGDWHFHALHNDGTITSFGKEPMRCGALGLGGSTKGNDVSRRTRTLRGIITTAQDANLIPEATKNGRRVWFEPEKQDWLQFLAAGGADPEEAKQRLTMLTRQEGIVEMSEWIEREGNRWDRTNGNEHKDEDGLGAYFALSVSAAGWHSGALVLVNEKLVEKMRSRGEFWKEQTFPRLKLADGTEMPGTVAFSD